MSSEHDTSEFEELTEVDELRRVISGLQSQVRRGKATRDLLSAAAREGAREAFSALGRPPKVPSPKSYAARDHAAEVAVLHLSDWQLGKKTSSYDSQVAEQRLTLLGEKFVHMVDIERADHPVDEAWLLFGGDHVEGVNVFPGQHFEIDSTLFAQQALASRLLVNLTRLACRTVKTVHVVTEDGNHGRIGRRGELPKGDNSDAFTYYAAWLQVQDLIEAGRLVWHWPTHGWYSIFEIGSYRGLLVHGDEIKSFGGNMPAFGISRKVTAWASGVIEPFHDCYMGHWHQPMVIPLPVGYRRIFVNPSIESDNVYAQEFVGAVGWPGQRLNFVSPSKGRCTTERVLWLD